MKRITAIITAAVLSCMACATMAEPSTAEKAGQAVGGFFRSAGKAVADGATAVGHASRDAYHGLKKGLKGEGEAQPKPAPEPAPVVPPTKIEPAGKI